MWRTSDSDQTIPIDPTPRASRIPRTTRRQQFPCSGATSMRPVPFAANRPARRLLSTRRTPTTNRTGAAPTARDVRSGIPARRIGQLIVAAKSATPTLRRTTFSLHSGRPLPTKRVPTKRVPTRQFPTRQFPTRQFLDQTRPDQTRRKAVGAIAVDPPGRGHTELCPPYDLADPGSDSGHSLTFDGAPNGWSTGRVPFVFATQQGRHTHLNVTIAATTLAGLDDLPGELDGHGPISADVCRALAVSAASIAAVAVDTSCGTALDVGRTTYRPRLSHRDHVVQRDRTCRFPGCRQPARRCQIDHSEEFCSGGATCPCNLACLCKFHHDLKTTGLWDAQQYPDASILWTSPTGRTYRTETPEWPIAAPKHQTRPSTSTVDDAESCNTGDARMPAGTKPTTPDEPPF